METKTVFIEFLVRAASKNASLIKLVREVLKAQALCASVKPVVDALAKSELSTNAYSMEEDNGSLRPFTYEDYLSGWTWLMPESDSDRFFAAMDARYATCQYAYLVDGKSNCSPLRVAEYALISANRAMMDQFKALSGAFSMDDLMAAGISTQKGIDIVIGLVTTGNPKTFKTAYA